MFSVGDNVLHPLHGAGRITAIVAKQNGGKRQMYYALHLALDDVVIYIPVSHSGQVGLRPICSLQQARRILCGPPEALPEQPSNWNCRYRENMERIRSGNIRLVAQVVASLWLKNRRRALAGSEKRMLECAEKILHSELMLATGLSQEEICRRLADQWKKLH